MSGRRSVVAVDRPGADTRVVAFSGHPRYSDGEQVVEPFTPFEVFVLIQNLPVSRAFIRDLAHDWYRGGLAGYGCDLPGSLRSLAASLSAVRHTICWGICAGAPAALIASTILGVDSVHLIAPRWPTSFPGLWDENGASGLPPDLPSWLSSLEYQPRVEIWYAGRNTEDDAYAKNLATCPGIVLRPLESASYYATDVMMGSNTMADALKASIAVPGAHR